MASRNQVEVTEKGEKNTGWRGRNCQEEQVEGEGAGGDRSDHQNTSPSAPPSGLNQIPDLCGPIWWPRATCGC